MKIRRTKALDISKKVKDTVWERDNHRCILCGSHSAMPNAMNQQKEIEDLRIEMLRMAKGDANAVDNFVAAHTTNKKKLDDLNLQELKMFVDMIKQSKKEDK